MIHLRFVLPCGLPVGAIVAFHQSPLPHSQYGTNYCTIERTRADVNGILGSKSTYMGNWPHFLPVSLMGCCDEQSWCNTFVQSLRCCSFDRRKGRFLLRPERQQICPHTASPPLPPEYNTIVTDPNISRLSRQLNLIFSFAALESSHTFPAPGNPSFVAIAGRVYHRLRSSPEANSAVRWLLYDGFDPSAAPHNNTSIPPQWITLLRECFL